MSYQTDVTVSVPATRSTSATTAGTRATGAAATAAVLAAGGSGTTSAAEPERLGAYGTTAAGVDEALARALGRLEPDVAAFLAGAGDLAPAAATADWTTPLADLRAEVGHLGRWVADMGAAFLAAGADGDGDGVYRASDEVLAPLVGRALRSEHLEVLAAQLATLHERARSGDLDLTAGDLAQLVSAARLVVDGAADPRTEAERLVAAMGSGDLVTALTLLSSGAADATGSDHTAVAALLDLGHILSLGLESDPARTERWADEIVDHTVFGTLPGPLLEGLAVMAGGNAPGTSVLGSEVAGALVAGGRSAPVGGLVHRLYGITDPLAPVMTSAATRGPDGAYVQATLAHAITGRAVDDPAAMVRIFGGEAPRAYDAVRRDVLVAAVDPSLPDDRRVLLADGLAHHYVAARESPVATTFGLRLYSPTVTEGFGTALQPLLDHWQGEAAGRVSVESPDGRQVTLGDGRLWGAVGHLGQDPGGTLGLSSALTGTTTTRLAASYATASDLARAGAPTGVSPFTPDDLDRLGEVYRTVASTVGNARFNAVVDAVESDGDRLEAALTSVTQGVVSELPGGATVTSAAEALDILTRDQPEVTGGGSTMSGLAVHLTRDLVAFTLQARPDLATPGVVAALREAKATDGDLGVHLLIHDDGAPLDTGGGRALADLQRLVDHQEERIDLELALALDEVTQREGG
ncbi:MAG TPA: hypothetical protein VFP06_03035 [Acidimicrobiales bacterium]|nr:hypothetical protein [Acidimicrobiales bacterium]